MLERNPYDSTRHRLREEAEQALGELGDPSAVPGLIATLNHAPGHVKDGAARALGKLGDPRTVEPPVVIRIWALSVSDLNCSRGDIPEQVEKDSGHSRGYIMLEDSLRRTADLDSVAFMYLSGRRWSAGDSVGSTHFNQRIILSGREDAPEYEFRKVDDRTWWRTRGTDGWRESGYPANLERVVEPESSGTEPGASCRECLRPDCETRR